MYVVSDPVDPTETVVSGIVVETPKLVLGVGVGAGMVVDGRWEVVVVEEL